MGLFGKILGSQPAKKASDDVLLLHAMLLMASAEQMSTQALQPTVALRLWAQSFCLYSKNLGFSNSPTNSRSLSTVARSRPSLRR